jgi:hypothetical protein
MAVSTRLCLLDFAPLQRNDLGTSRDWFRVVNNLNILETDSIKTEFWGKEAKTTPLTPDYKLCLKESLPKRGNTHIKATLTSNSGMTVDNGNIPTHKSTVGMAHLITNLLDKFPLTGKLQISTNSTKLKKELTSCFYVSKTMLTCRKKLGTFALFSIVQTSVRRGFTIYVYVAQLLSSAGGGGRSRPRGSVRGRRRREATRRSRESLRRSSRLWPPPVAEAAIVTPSFLCSSFRRAFTSARQKYGIKGAADPK